MATSIPQSAENQTRFLSTTSTKKRMHTGSADTNVESGHECSGS